MRRAEPTTRHATPATPPYSMKINGGPGMYSIGGLYSIKQDTRRGSTQGAGEGTADSDQAYPVNGTAQADAYASTPPLTPWGAPLTTPRDEKGPYEEFITRIQSSLASLFSGGDRIPPDCRRSGSVRTLGLAPRVTRRSTRASCRGSIPEPTIHEGDETEGDETENDDTSGSESSPHLGPSEKGFEACYANGGASAPTTPTMPASHAQAAGGAAAEPTSEEQALARIYQNVKEEARRRLLLQQLLAEEVRRSSSLPEEFVPPTMQPQAEVEAEAAQPETSASSTSASSASPSSASASTPSSSSADSPAAQAKAVALGVFAGRSRPKPKQRTLNAMFAMPDRGSPPRAMRATARSPLVEGAPSLASPAVPEEEEATVETGEVAEEAPAAQSERLSGEEAGSAAESPLSEQVLPLAAALAVTELPPVTPRDKSPAAPFRPAPPSHEKLLEVAMQGPKNWLEGIKNGLPISKPSSAPSGPLCGPCKSCVSRGKPLQLAAPSDVLLLDLRTTTTTTTRNTEALSVSVA